MSSSYPPPSDRSTFALISKAFAFCSGARFTGLLEPAFFQQAADRSRLRFGSGQGDTFDPAVTLWAWLSQALSPAKSCTAAVSRVMALCCGLGQVICSSVTGAFCKARAKLPHQFLSELTVCLGQRIEQKAPQSWKWRGRTVKLVDGFLLSMLDTKENLQEYPQQRCVKPGTSYTCMRVVALLGLATGVLLGAACGAYKGKGAGELSLLLRILDAILASDVLVGDRCYDCYLLLALLRGKGADGCFRLNVKRLGGFGQQGQRLGEDDWLQTWRKPSRPRRTIDEQTWDSLPDEIAVRVLRFWVSQRGFRTKEVYVVTTLTDAVAYSKEDVAALYFRRWDVEVDVRSLKQGLGLKMLSCKTPGMVRAELWTHLLGYNLTRCVMAQAALDKGLLPRQVSFQGARDTLDAFRWLLTCAEKDPELMRQVISTAVASHKVGNRPGRYEPREIKHRQRKYKELKKPRQQRRQELQEQGQEQQEQQKKQAGRRKGAGKDRPSGR